MESCVWDATLPQFEHSLSFILQSALTWPVLPQQMQVPVEALAAPPPPPPLPPPAERQVALRWPVCGMHDARVQVVDCGALQWRGVCRHASRSVPWHAGLAMCGCQLTLPQTEHSLSFILHSAKRCPVLPQQRQALSPPLAMVVGSGVVATAVGVCTAVARRAKATSTINSK